MPYSDYVAFQYVYYKSTSTSMLKIIDKIIIVYW